MRTFKADNGNTLTAINDIQAEAMISAGMVEVTGEISEAKPITKAEAKAMAKAAAAKAKAEAGGNDPSISDESDESQDEEQN